MPQLYEGSAHLCSPNFRLSDASKQVHDSQIVIESLINKARNFMAEKKFLRAACCYKDALDSQNLSPSNRIIAQEGLQQANQDYKNYVAVREAYFTWKSLDKNSCFKIDLSTKRRVLDSPMFSPKLEPSLKRARLR